MSESATADPSSGQSSRMDHGVPGGELAPGRALGGVPLDGETGHQSRLPTIAASVCSAGGLPEFGSYGLIFGVSMVPSCWIFGRDFCGVEQQGLLEVLLARGVEAVDRVVDVAHGGPGGAGARTALGDRHDDRVVLGVGGEPRGRLLAVDLGRTRLGVHRDLVLRPAAEPPGGGAAGRDTREGSVDLVAGLLGEGQLAVRLGLDLLDALAVAADDRLADGGVVEGAAVGDRGVDGRHLDRRDEGVTLADRVVDGVTGTHLVAFEAVLVGDLLDVRAVLLALLAPGVVVGLGEVLLPLAVRDPAADLVGEVDAGLLAEAELVGGLVEPVVGLLLRVVPAVLLPLLVRDAVVHGVAGDLQGAADGDVAVALGLEVLEGLATDGVRAGAGVVAVEGVSGVDRGGRGDHLEDRAGGGLALDGPVQQREVGALSGELGVVLAGDAADPGVGVVVGQRGHRDDAAGLGLHDDDGAGVGLVVLAGVGVELGAGRLHGLVELVLRDGLDPGVDRGDDTGSRPPPCRSSPAR